MSEGKLMAGFSRVFTLKVELVVEIDAFPPVAINGEPLGSHGADASLRMQQSRPSWRPCRGS